MQFSKTLALLAAVASIAVAAPAPQTNSQGNQDTATDMTAGGSNICNGDRAAACCTSTVEDSDTQAMVNQWLGTAGVIGPLLTNVFQCSMVNPATAVGVTGIGGTVPVAVTNSQNQQCQQPNFCCPQGTTNNGNGNINAANIMFCGPIID